MDYDFQDLSTEAAMNMWFSAFSVDAAPSESIYAPQIITPAESAQYNQSVVAIAWSINSPPTDSDETETSSISYEIEYTDDYRGALTNWYTLKRRIPYATTSYSWNVGKMIKSNSVRIRMRARNQELERVSDWSISDEFSINVFKLIPPAIISPTSNILYSDFIMVILDESLTRDSYHQKVRYTLEYSSDNRDIDWTVIRANVPFGQNVIRWDIDGLLPSDDYVLKLTVRNTSTCFETPETDADQIARRFVHDISIQQAGMFIVDTRPPQAVIEIENSTGVTNQLAQTVNVFADDETTEVKTVQMRECDAGSILALGDLEDPYDPTGGCTPIADLLEDLSQFGKEVGSSTKLQWVFEDSSGLKKLETLLTDSGGNTSIQEDTKVFLNSFKYSSLLTDFEIVIEQRDQVTIDETTTPPSVIVEPSVFEVVYVGTSIGEFWVLEPYARLLYTVTGAPSISKVVSFSDTLYLFTYDSITDASIAYRHDVSEPTSINTFTTALSIPRGTAEYLSALYVGMENGELWKFNGLSFSLITTFADPISTMYADREYLYVGFQNTAALQLYNGTSFFEVTL
jgi:hypothetical protein